nr:uncharacterized protein DDB_G0290685-like [Drosophila bipectinata]
MSAEAHNYLESIRNQDEDGDGNNDEDEYEEDLESESYEDDNDNSDEDGGKNNNKAGAEGNEKARGEGNDKLGGGTKGKDGDKNESKVGGDRSGKDGGKRNSKDGDESSRKDAGENNKSDGGRNNDHDGDENHNNDDGEGEDKDEYHARNDRNEPGSSGTKEGATEQVKKGHVAKSELLEFHNPSIDISLGMATQVAHIQCFEYLARMKRAFAEVKLPKSYGDKKEAAANSSVAIIAMLKDIGRRSAGSQDERKDRAMHVAKWDILWRSA